MEDIERTLEATIALTNFFRRLKELDARLCLQDNFHDVTAVTITDLYISLNDRS